MRKLIIWFFIHLLIVYAQGCNPVKEIKEVRDAAEKANRETKTLMENVRGYAEHYFPLY